MKTRMIKVLVNSAYATLDIPKAISVGQLGESHAQKLIEICKRANPAVTLISLNTPTELPLGQKVYNLRKYSAPANTVLL